MRIRPRATILKTRSTKIVNKPGGAWLSTLTKGIVYHYPQDSSPSAGIRRSANSISTVDWLESLRQVVFGAILGQQHSCKLRASSMRYIGTSRSFPTKFWLAKELGLWQRGMGPIVIDRVASPRTRAQPQRSDVCKNIRHLNVLI